MLSVLVHLHIVCISCHQAHALRMQTGNPYVISWSWFYNKLCHILFQVRDIYDQTKTYENLIWSSGRSTANFWSTDVLTNARNN